MSLQEAELEVGASLGFLINTGSKDCSEDEKGFGGEGRERNVSEEERSK